MKDQRAFLGRLCVIASLPAAVLIVVSSGPAAAQQDGPSKAVREVMQYAPPQADGLAHVDVGAVLKEAFAELRKHADLMQDIPPGALDAVEKLAQKVDAVDIFMIFSPKGPPIPLAVIHGKLGAEDINAMLGAITDGGLALKPMEEPKGFHELRVRGPDLHLAVGGEADGLPAGVCLLGLGPMLNTRALANLGKTPNRALMELLKEVDTSAPVWFALDLKKVAYEEAPRAVSGAICPLGKGRSKVSTVFKDAKQAEAFAKQWTEGGLLSALTAVADLRRDGATVTIVGKSDRPLLNALARATAEARAKAKRALSMANLRRIGMGLLAYAADRKGCLPPDLLSLKRYGVSADMLVSPVSGKKVKLDKDGNPVGGFEPEYVYLMAGVNVEQVTEPAGAILAYEKPENYDKKGTSVLYVDCHVEWVKMEQFKSQLKATTDWLAKQEK
ncbi:MAG TPA: hypothetical protein VNA25_11650 [Phycisphaerae bacterium]|nr:hypothetical protein [Phycisphaerae bacterium]